MTKLFLQSGKLMIGEFPEEPKAFIPETEEELRIAEHEAIHELPNPSPWKAYYAAVESAKASAVEVVNGEDYFHKINDWLTPLPGGGLGRQLQKGELCDLPKGWTVEIEDVPLKLYKQKVVEKIARLVPSENAQGAHYGDACGICGGPCVVGSKGLYCPKCQPNKALNEVGIVATGIPEAEQPEALAFLNEDDWTVPKSGEKPGHDFIKYLKRNELDYYNQREEWNEDTPQWRMYNAIAAEYILIRNHFEKHFSVFPLSQADRDSQEELWKEAINLYSKRDHSADGRADMMKEFTITRNTKP